MRKPGLHIGGMDQLEPRTLFAAFVVSSAADSGAGSLREAIAAANTSAGSADTISFAIGSGAQSIALAAPLPNITDPLTIDGSTQPGYAGTPLIEINGFGAGFNTGFIISAGNSTLRALTINRFGFDAIQLNTAGGNRIEACYIGTNTTGDAASANVGAGIYITGSSNNTVGGATFTSPAGTFSARNVISGNSFDGIFIENSTGNSIRNNYIGVDVGGSFAIGNRSNGVVFGSNVTNSTMGGLTATDRNVISGNLNDGVQLIGSNVTGNVVQGNYIGTRATGSNPVPNGNNGVDLNGLSGSVTNNTIGGTASGARNVLSGNTGDGVQIEGTGASGNFVQGNYIGIDFNGASAVANQNDGVNIRNAPNNVIGGTSAAARNVISGNAKNGIEIQNTSSTGNLVQGNYIGLNAAGTGAVRNSDDGIDINSASNNTIGGTVAGAANVISGNNSDGIEIAADGSRFPGNAADNLVQGNFIGTNPAGTGAIANSAAGVRIVDNFGTTSATNNTIGGTTAAARNIISGNLAYGVLVQGAKANGNFVRGNYIGTDVAGAAAIANGTPGITPTGGGARVLSNSNTIAGNVISGNVTDGVDVTASSITVQGNLIGVRPDGTTALGNGGSGVKLADGSNNTVGGVGAGLANVIAFNGDDGVVIGTPTTAPHNVSVRGNSIHSNGDMGIDLVPLGATANDPGDADAGPNSLQNFPVLATAAPSGASTTITGTLNSTPNATFVIDFYSDTSADASGFGEARTYLDSASVTTDAAGNATINASVPIAVPNGSLITATATSVATNETSEFAQNIIVGATGRTIVNGDAGGVASDDVVRIVRSGSQLLVFVNSATPTQTVDFATSAGVTFNGIAGNDTLVLDYTGGEIVPAAGIDFDGGAGTADRLQVVGASGTDAFVVAPNSIGHTGSPVAFANSETLDLQTGTFTVGVNLNGLGVNTAGSVIFNAPQQLASLTLAAGANVTLSAGGDKLIETGALAIAGGATPSATLNLNDGDMLVHNANLGDIASLINSARSGGAWTGAGVTSTAARNMTPKITTLGPLSGAEFLAIRGAGATFDNVPVVATDVLVKYTYYGDADFNGAVNFDDYSRTDAGFNLGRRGWLNGDYDGNGVVNFDDYSLIDLAFNAQGAAQRPASGPAGGKRPASLR